jgi:myo-inositol-1(or 4)-monophosphatase
VYDPTRDDLFSAAAGLGATRNDERLAVSTVGDLEGALLVTGFPYTVRDRPDPIVRLFQAFLVRAQGVRRDGSAALNLCYVAAGRFDGFWEAHLNAWDLAAGTLIVREAGGRVTGWGGAPLDLFARHVIASNGHVHDALREVIAAHGDSILEGATRR